MIIIHFITNCLLLFFYNLQSYLWLENLELFHSTPSQWARFDVHQWFLSPMRHMFFERKCTFSASIWPLFVGWILAAFFQIFSFDIQHTLYNSVTLAMFVSLPMWSIFWASHNDLEIRFDCDIQHYWFYTALVVATSHQLLWPIEWEMKTKLNNKNFCLLNPNKQSTEFNNQMKVNCQTMALYCLVCMYLPYDVYDLTESTDRINCTHLRQRDWQYFFHLNSYA